MHGRAAGHDFCVGSSGRGKAKKDEQKKKKKKAKKKKGGGGGREADKAESAAASEKKGWSPRDSKKKKKKKKMRSEVSSARIYLHRNPRLVRTDHGAPMGFKTSAQELRAF